jgi:succinate-semialdehyde dehydrogenase/glutarate-semialdehyde dehydrogenase
MTLVSIDPCTGTTLAAFVEWEPATTAQALDAVGAAWPAWRDTPLATRADALRAVAAVLRARTDELAAVMAAEMGKPVTQGRGEIGKCALVCEYYAANGAAIMAPEPVASDAVRSYVAWEAMGAVLAVMPWNFPFWQVFRLAAPCLVGGNVMVLKHASNVPQCAMAIERVFQEAGLPEGVFRTLMIGASQVQAVLAHPAVCGVSLTGSGPAGAKVASMAGALLKKSLLELGGSDPFVVLADADLEQAAATGVMARCANAGQVCIAAKRFIVEEPVYDAFLELMARGVAALKVGDPREDDTVVGPLARRDLVGELQAQVDASVAAGARLVCGGAPLPGPGAFYAPTILADVTPGMAAFDEETFGPVAAVIRARDAEHALTLANATPFGLGASVWTRDRAKGEAMARRIEAGSVFVNGQVKSDPRLPFGGIKASGYGRELSTNGMREFMNQKTVWIG